MPTINLSELLFNEEAETEVLRLATNRHLVSDLDYFWNTADMVVEGFDPITSKPITVTGLEAWSARCQQKEPSADAAAYHTTVQDDPYGSFRDTSKTVYPRRLGSLLEYS